MISIPFEEYLAREGVSKSKLSAFARAPILAHAAVEETAAMRMGSLVHCAILEPEELEKRYCVTDLDRRGTKAWDAEEKAAEGRELVKRIDFETALAMRDAVWASATARELLTGCVTEQSVFWTNEVVVDGDSLKCKARADAINARMGVILDVKTTTDASPQGFAKQFANMDYGLQDVHYLEGFDMDDFVFIAVEKTPPFLVATYEMSRQDRDAMWRRRDDLLIRYAECLKSNEWPGYEEGIQTLKLPGWATNN